MMLQKSEFIGFPLLQSNHNSPSQPFALLNESPWPLFLAVSTFFLLLGAVDFFHGGGSVLLFVSLFVQSSILGIWTKDIFREASFEGGHTIEIKEELQWGMGWFISSEIFFFVSFFWAFFHFSLAPSVESGSVWPPLHVSALGPFAVPLLNTVVLISSGASFTWAHHSILSGASGEAKMSLIMTILLGGYFTLLQGLEYSSSSFSFNDSIYGSIFFLATGFHGCHVLIGTILLSISLYRLYGSCFSSTHHVGLELGGWYWHFVDVVWLFLFSCVYWWGS